MASLLEVRRPELEKMICCRRFIAPRVDSLHGEEEDDEAETMARSDLLWVAKNGVEA